MNAFKTATLLLVVGLAAPAQVQAQGQGLSAPQQAEYKRNCTADYSRLCANYAPDSPEVVQCFQRRINEVSPRCQNTIAKFQRGAR